MGPLIDEEQRTWVHRHVADAVHDGAELRTGGAVPDGPGFFYPPTVLAGPAVDAPVLREQTFGPVAAVCAVSSFDDALSAAGECGRAVTVLTPSQAHAHRAWREPPVPAVNVNAVSERAPGPELLDEMTRAKLVHLAPCPEPGQGTIRGH
jgi:acyl-CoA reductase-like NAD-dependent aldehyde dehydrogenase